MRDGQVWSLDDFEATIACLPRRARPHAGFLRLARCVASIRALPKRDDFLRLLSPHFSREAA